MTPHPYEVTRVATEAVFRHCVLGSRGSIHPVHPPREEDLSKMRSAIEDVLGNESHTLEVRRAAVNFILLGIYTVGYELAKKS